MAENKGKVREKLRERIRELEIRDREGYRTEPQERDELSDWESEAVWPPDYPLYETPRLSGSNVCGGRYPHRRPRNANLPASLRAGRVALI